MAKVCAICSAVRPFCTAIEIGMTSSLAFGATLRAPHGGIFVVGLIGNWPLYLLAIAIGTVVSAALVIVAKGIGRNTKGETATS